MDAKTGETFKRLAALVGVCPFARACVTVNYYWYGRSKDFVKEVCLTEEHKKCTTYEGFKEQEKSPWFNEEQMVTGVRKNSLYRPCPWIVALENGLSKQKSVLPVSADDQRQARAQRKTWRDTCDVMEIARELEKIQRRRGKKLDRPR